MLRHFTNFVRVKRAQVNIVKSEQVDLPMLSLCFFFILLVIDFLGANS